MERHGDSHPFFVPKDFVTAALSSQRKALSLKRFYCFSGSNARKSRHVLRNRNFDRGENHVFRLFDLLFFCSHILKVELYCVVDICKSLFVRIALRIAALQRGAAGEVTISVSLYNDGKTIFHSLSVANRIFPSRTENATLSTPSPLIIPFRFMQRGRLASIMIGKRYFITMNSKVVLAFFELESQIKIG